MRSTRDTLSIPLIATAPLGSSKWLLHLRSFAVAGQMATILATQLLTSITLPYTPLLMLVGLTAATNAIYAWWLSGPGHDDAFVRIDSPSISRRIRDHGSHFGGDFGGDQSRDAASDSGHDSGLSHSVALGLMVLDLLTLTAMLHLSGGAGNPFSFFYFVNLAVGGVMIRPRAAWSLTATAIVGYAFLLLSSTRVAGVGDELPMDNELNSLGLMLAFSACSTVVTYFVTRTAGQLRQREQQLLRAQAEQAASHRLEGLTTLAAVRRTN